MHTTSNEVNKGNTAHTRKLCISAAIMTLAILIGMIQVTQSGMNIALARWTNHAFRSAFIQFLIGALVLFPLFLFCKPAPPNGQNTQSERNVLHNLYIALQKDKKNCFVFCNSLCALNWISTAIYVAPQLGFGLYAICIVLGQIISSLLIDHFGLIWSERKPLSWQNIVGSVVAILGVVTFQIPHIVDKQNAFNPLWIVYILTAIFAGVCFTTLSALNARLKHVMHGTPFQAAFLLFFNTMILALIVNIGVFMVRKDWFLVNESSLRWYQWFGGVCGAFVVSMYIICLSYIGFVATYICSIFGSLVLSLVYDIVGAFGIEIEENGVSVLKLVGCVLVLTGAVMMNLKRAQQAGNDHKSSQEAVYSQTALDELDEGKDDEIEEEMPSKPEP